MIQIDCFLLYCRYLRTEVSFQFKAELSSGFLRKVGWFYLIKAFCKLLGKGHLAFYVIGNEEVLN